MVTKTLRYPVFFGRTVSAEAKAVSYKTSCQIPDWGNAFEFSKIVSAGNQEVYKKIDLAEQKKKKVYRKINKMVNGY